MSSVSRRDFAKVAAASMATVSTCGCEDAGMRLGPPLPNHLSSESPVLAAAAERTLARLTFGARAEDRVHMARVGVERFIEEQLHPDDLPENPELVWRLRHLDTLGLGAVDARDFELGSRESNIVSRSLSRVIKTPGLPTTNEPGQAARELRFAHLLRATYSRRQLQEVMVDFWTNHFSIDLRLGDCTWLKTVDDRLIRQHTLGKFRDLLSASMHSPAMLYYLDNVSNRARDGATSLKPNENYARELLELHTLGVNGGYQHADIEAVARCMAGWRIASDSEASPGEVVFRSEWHDNDAKVVLGQPIVGRDGAEIEELADLLSRHPSTAAYIAHKLCRHFVADNPSESVVKAVATVFQNTDGDLRQVLAALFRHPEFTQSSAVKFKRPFEFAVSAMRATDADVSSDAVLDYLEKMGQSPFDWPTPDGYPDQQDTWMGGLLDRWNFALELVQGKIPGVSIRLGGRLRRAQVDDLATFIQATSNCLLGRNADDAIVSQMQQVGAKLGRDDAARFWIALVMSSPQFQWN